MGQRTFDNDCFMTHGMNEFHPMAQQTYTSVGIATARTILQVTLYRTADICQLAPNLMVTTRLQVYLE